MTYIPDLDPYTYRLDSIPEGVEALAVGWLDSHHAFPIDEPSPRFIDLLFEVCRNHPRVRTRGWHACEFCWTQDIRDLPIVVRLGDGELPVGDAEIRLSDGRGRWLVAPTMIVHYVAGHGYAPPSVFVDAVLTGRLAADGESS